MGVLTEFHPNATPTNVSNAIWGNYKWAQSFQIAENATVQSIQLMLYKQGSPPNAKVAIQANSDTTPSGVDLVSKTVTTLPASYEWVTFTFDTPQALNATTTYWIVLTNPESGSSGNNVRWGSESVGGYASGQSAYYTTSWALKTYDAYFIVNGTTAPSKATTPSPADTSIDQSCGLVELSWVDGGGAVTYDVYFGETGSMVLVSSAQAGLTFSLTSYHPLEYETEYSWRIDSTNGDGTTTGDVWTFTTIALTPPTPSGIAKQVKRMIVVGDDTVYYSS